jgi:DnaK suppressor protein
MRKTDLIRFKKIFVQQREQILMNMTLVDEHLMVRPEENKDEVDQATTGIEQNMRMQMKNRENQTLKKIEEALRRIDEGSYGDCESCEEVIEIRRLQARPTTTLCIACKEEEEKHRASNILGHRLDALH